MNPTDLKSARPSRLTLWVGAGLLLSAALVVFTLNPTVSAQSPAADLNVEELTITKIGESATGIKYRASATISNSSGTDFSGVRRVDYRIDDNDPQLAYIVTNLPDTESVRITFEIELKPGNRTIRVIVGESAVTQSLSVPSADLTVEIAGHRTEPGGTVLFDIHIANHGELVARNVALSAAWRTDDDLVSGTLEYDRNFPAFATGDEVSIPVRIDVPTGTYQFSFEVTTSTPDGDLENNTTAQILDIEYVDLIVEVVAIESLGWDGEGKALMSMVVQVENAGVNGMNTFYIGIECEHDRTSDCATSEQSDQVPAGEKTETELRMWLPIGDTPTRIFAVENEDTFLWGDSNAINATITAPVTPEQIWTLNRVTDPSVISYWSDGSANVELGLNLVNNGTNEPFTVNIECFSGETLVDECGAELSGELETGVYPTIVRPSLRLPSGDTMLKLSYGAEEPKTAMATVPHRIVGVERDVWDCFSDTSNIGPEFEDNDSANDGGIGCAGWDRDHIIKWPVGETIQLWTHGETLYLEILGQVLSDVGSLLNVEFEEVDSKDDAQLTVHTGVSRQDADFTGLDCVDFGGCAQTHFDENGQITASNIAIWLIDIQDEKRLHNQIRSTTLHELLHALTNIEHRHHDRTSVMSYDALDYVTVDGMDRGLFDLIGDPLVQPGMTFDELRELIVFADELNDPPEPVELSASALLRRAHATLMDAESFSFRVTGDWPGCRGSHDFGPAELQLANLRPYSALWRHFHDGTDRYYYVGNPSDWPNSEWWLRRGRTWQDVGGSRVSDATTFRGGFSSLLQILSYINIYAEPSDYSIKSRTSSSVKIEIDLNQPNPSWSRSLDLEITITMHPETYQITKYELDWEFNPRNRNNCDEYTVRATSPVYGVEFNFPDAIWEESTILVQPEAPDETEIEVEVVADVNPSHMQPSLPQSRRD